MPRATIGTDTVRKDLKSLPEGYVILRAMPYGDWLQRQQIMLRMEIEAARGNGAGKKRDFKGSMSMSNKEVTLFEFQRCIVEHNLENDNGELLDFKNPTSIHILNPKVGNEIGDYINELHNADAEGNSLSEPTLS